MLNLSPARGLVKPFPLPLFLFLSCPPPWHEELFQPAETLLPVTDHAGCWLGRMACLPLLISNWVLELQSKSTVYSVYVGVSSPGCSQSKPSFKCTEPLPKLKVPWIFPLSTANANVQEASAVLQYFWNLSVFIAKGFIQHTHNMEPPR